MWTTETHARHDRSNLRYPSDSTEAEWSLIAPLIPPAKRGGRYERQKDEREVIEYAGSGGATQAWYAYGLGANEVLNRMNVSAGTRQTMIPDRQGSIFGLLDSGGTLSRAGYQAFGENPSAITGSFRFTGQRFDAETAGSAGQPSGLYYYRARMYSPALGRFLQADPIGYAGGGHLYAYAGNDPLNKVDPLGLWTLQVGGSVYFNLGWFSFQASGGIVSDSHGNAGYYANGNAGPAVGGGFKFAGNGAYSTAPTVNDLNGYGAGVSATAGAGAAGSLDWSKGIANNGQPYNSYGGSLGLGAGGGVSAGPSRTGIWCQIGPDCGTSSAPAPGGGTTSTPSAQTSLVGQASLMSSAQGGAAPGSTESGGQSSATK